VDDPAFPLERRFEMGITRPDFVRLLDGAIDHGAWVGQSTHGTWRGIAWRLRIAELPKRRIAELALPVLEVTLSFATTDEAAAAPFIERFHRAFQRAGG
jgi:hypothetical protein